MVFILNPQHLIKHLHEGSRESQDDDDDDGDDGEGAGEKGCHLEIGGFKGRERKSLGTLTRQLANLMIVIIFNLLTV